MIKIIGFLIVLISSCKIGLDISNRYSERTKELRSVIQALEIIKTEIEFSNSLLFKALEHCDIVKNKSVSNLMLKISKSLKNNETISNELFENNNLALHKSDIDILTDIFLTLGAGNTQNEVNNINNGIDRLKASINNSLDDEKKYCKLSKVSGLLIGIFIGIMFI